MGPPPGAALAKHKVDELRVFIRLQREAERRWGRTIAEKENMVRRCMMIEDQCREQLRSSVLRGTYAYLKNLETTDLLSTALVSAPAPSIETFLAYGVTPQQLTAFSVFALARISADPDRLDVPPLVLISDLQDTWSVLPRAKKAAYEKLAVSYRAQMMAPEVPPPVETGGARTAKQTRVRSARQRVRQAAAQRPTQELSASSPNDCRAGPVEARSTTAPRLPPVPPHEESAFGEFAKAAHRQMKIALRNAKLSKSDWLPIAQAEWATKSERQKRFYSKE